jgi:hypothetical protein
VLPRAITGSFTAELSKLSSLAEHALDVGGLGVLAAPHLYHSATGKKVSDKTERNTELAGLGILAAHPAYTLAKSFKPAGVMAKLKKVL